MKNLYLLFTCCLLFTGGACAQTTDEKVEAKLVELRRTGVDHIIMYHAYCAGLFYVRKDTVNCFPDSENIKYILWSKRGVNYIQRFDGCYNYTSIVGKSGPVFKLISLHLSSLIKDTIKEVQYVDPNTHQLSTKYGGDHGCYADFYFYTTSKTIRKHISYFDLDTEFTDDYTSPKVKHRNINYKYNQQTNLKRLNDIIKQEISTLTFAKVN